MRVEDEQENLGIGQKKTRCRNGMQSVWMGMVAHLTQGLARSAWKVRISTVCKFTKKTRYRNVENACRVDETSREKWGRSKNV